MDAASIANNMQRLNILRLFGGSPKFTFMHSWFTDLFMQTKTAAAVSVFCEAWKSKAYLLQITQIANAIWNLAICQQTIVAFDFAILEYQLLQACHAADCIPKLIALHSSRECLQNSLRARTVYYNHYIQDSLTSLVMLKATRPDEQSLSIPARRTKSEDLCTQLITFLWSPANG